MILVEGDRRFPVVTFTIVFGRGRIDDPPGRLGLGSLTTRMLRRGTARLDGAGVEHRLDALGAELRTWVGLGITTLTVDVLARHVEAVVELVGDLLTEPRHDPEEWARLRAQVGAELVRDRDDDGLLVDRALRGCFFGTHPHGRVSLERTTLDAVSLEEVAACHADRFVRAGALVGWCGDVDDGHAEALSRRLLARLPVGAARPYPCADPEPVVGRRLVRVDKPGRSQARLAIGLLGTRGDDPDHIALQLAHTAFAGTFTAPLNQVIRTDRGLAYDVSSHLLIGRIREVLQISASPATEDAPETLALALELLDEWVTEGPSDDALEHARRYLRARRPFERDTAAKRLAQRIEEEVLGLPPGYHADFLERLDAVTGADARAAVQARVDPTGAWVAALGDETLHGPLTDVLGTIEEARTVAYDEV